MFPWLVMLSCHPLAPSALPDFIATMSGSDSRDVMTSSSVVNLGLRLRQAAPARAGSVCGWRHDAGLIGSVLTAMSCSKRSRTPGRLVVLAMTPYEMWPASLCIASANPTQLSGLNPFKVGFIRYLCSSHSFVAYCSRTLVTRTSARLDTGPVASSYPGRAHTASVNTASPITAESSPGDCSPGPSQNRTCGFPASGSQLSSFASVRGTGDGRCVASG
jgi:hypothetical protein